MLVLSACMEKAEIKILNSVAYKVGQDFFPHREELNTVKYVV